MIRILKKHKKVGILSPCSKSWGERQLLKKRKKQSIFGLFIIIVIF